MTTKKPNSTWVVGGVVSFYFVSSITLVFLNKLLTSDDAPFRGVILITYLQILISEIIVIGLGSISHKYPKISFVAPYEFDNKIAVTVMPVTLIFVSMLLFSNICLKQVDITYYTLAKSLSIFFNILFSKLLLGKSSTTNEILACTVVTIGFIIGVYGDSKLSIIGAFYGVSSSIFGTLYSVFVSSAIKSLNNNHWRLIHYNNTLSIILLLPILIISGEIPELLTLNIPNPFGFWFPIILSGFFGCMINFAIFLQIKYTSPITHTVAGTIKACLQSVMGPVLFGSVVSVSTQFGLFLSIVGGFWYSFLKVRAKSEAAKKSPIVVPQTKTTPVLSKHHSSNDPENIINNKVINRKADHLHSQ